MVLQMEKKKLKKVVHTYVTKTIVIVIDVQHEVKIHRTVLHQILVLDVQKIGNKLKNQHLMNELLELLNVLILFYKRKITYIFFYV